MRIARKHLVWMLALAVALGMTGVASAASTQHIEASISPNKVPKKKFTKGVALTTHTFTTGASGVGPTPEIQALPAETQTADIDYDKNIKFTSKGLPQCDVNQLTGTTSDQALQLCGPSLVGTGTAKAECGNPVTPSQPLQINDVVVNAFNGIPSGKDPTIILHSYAASITTTTILVGTLGKSPTSGFSQRLHVPVDPLAGGACTLTDFVVTVKKSYKAKDGKKKKKLNYVSARCKSKDKQIHYSSDWTYYFGAPPVNGVTTQYPCKPKG
jgi:hypothetical protein